MSEELVVGIDLSLNSSGITILNNSGKILHCEVIYPGYLRGQDRLKYIYERYSTLLRTFSDIKYIGFERQVPQQRYNYNAKNILDIAEAFGVLKLAMSELSEVRKIEIYQFTAQELKSFATGNGKATKEDMISSVPARDLKKLSSYILEYSLDDVVDAYWAAKKTIAEADSDHLYYTNLEGVTT